MKYRLNSYIYTDISRLNFKKILLNLKIRRNVIVLIFKIVNMNILKNLKTCNIKRRELFLFTFLLSIMMEILYKSYSIVPLKHVTFLRILLFLNNRSIVKFCEWGVKGGRGQKLVIFCSRHKCMTPMLDICSHINTFKLTLTLL